MDARITLVAAPDLPPLFLDAQESVRLPRLLRFGTPADLLGLVAARHVDLDSAAWASSLV
jgi:hypothetical protein